MNYQQFEKELRGGKLRPVYCLTGPEVFFKRQAIAALRRKVVGDGDPQLCLMQFEGDEADPAEVFDELRTRSFFADSKLIIIHNAGPFIRKHSEGLTRYVKKASSVSVLLLVADKLDGRTSAGKALKACSVECKRVYDNKLPGWLTRRAKAHGIRLDRDALMLLTDQIGSDLVQLDLQLDKLATLVGEGGRVMRQHVAQAVGYDKLVDGFKLTEALSERQPAQALEMLHRLLEQGEVPQRILGLVAWRFRQLRRTLRLLDDGVQGRQLARKIPTNPYFLNDLVRQAQRFSSLELMRKQSLLHQTDVSLKSYSEGDGELRLTERLVIDLCR